VHGFVAVLCRFCLKTADFAYLRICVYSSETYDEGLTENWKNFLISTNLIRSLRGTFCHNRRAEPSKDSKAQEGTFELEGMHHNRAVEEEKRICFVIIVIVHCLQ